MVMTVSKEAGVWFYDLCCPVVHKQINLIVTYCNISPPFKILLTQTELQPR